jgi:transposase
MPAHEAMRDLVRARATARRVLTKARQHLQGFLLRHGRIYRSIATWIRAYRRWLTTVRFDQPAQQIVLQDYIHAVEDAEARLARLERQIEELLPRWSMAPVVEAVQAMREIGLIVAVTVVAEVGDFSRFANPRQLTAYLGLVPSEHSSGSSIRRGGITKASNAHARRVLIACRPGSAASCSTGLNACPRQSARSPGRRSCVCATDIDASRRPAYRRW